ncbi:hypothetical protein MNBD_UNCLBAC01-1097 [hydrothermal vent metagenome]|uniref:Methyltransferase FkbM domain-containing protein n=1 Tax=hydrothermal vent metagenome TaxID=652676 RepID=A0A3B1DSQ7_9ZZZZ
MKNIFLKCCRFLFYKIKRVVTCIQKFCKLYVIRDPFTVSVNKWFKDDGDNTLRLNYPLTEDSIVLDVGGYEGEWSNKIYEKYESHIFIFEPVVKYYEKITNRFSSNKKIKVYNFGLADKDTTAAISMLNDGSSIYKLKGESEKIILKNIENFIKDNGIDKIDLIKINIEGGEYPLLKMMIEKNIINKCQSIQVQFHDFYPNAIALRTEIRESLKKTHFITYDYPFVWENWQKNV